MVLRNLLNIFENSPAYLRLRPRSPHEADPLKCPPPNQNPGGAAGIVKFLKLASGSRMPHSPCQQM